MVTIAAFNDEPELVELLLDSGADPALRNVEGKTALDYALELPKDSRLRNSPVLERLRHKTR